MSNISAIILTKNSENLLADCIDSVLFCNEIIIIDNNSTDRTVDLGRRLGARVETPVSSNRQKKQLLDFSYFRNLGLKKAKNKWIFYIDADERVSPDLKKSILEIINKHDIKFKAYKVLRKNFYFGEHPWPYIESLERLFIKSALSEWQGAIHETPIIKGEIGILNGFLLHYTHRDLTSMVNKTISWSRIEAELRYNAHHPPMTWWRFPRVMFTAFVNSYIKQRGYKASTVGLIESIYQAFSIFITYARLWEMQQKKKNI